MSNEGGDANSRQDSPSEADHKALVVRPKRNAIVNSTAYGKGRILARKAVSSGQLAFPPSRPASQLALKEHTRYISWLKKGQLDALNLTKTSHGEAAWQLLRNCQPAHITQSEVAGQLVRDMAMSSLESAFEHGPTVKARVCISKETVFTECDLEKNTFGSHYHIREPKTKVQEMAFSTARQHLQHWRDRGIMLKIALMRILPSEADEDDFQLRQAAECPKALHDILMEGLDWDWLKQLKDRHRLGGVISADLIVGSRDGLLPAQYSIRDRMLVQVRGKKRVLVIDPTHSFEGLYPYPVHHPYDTYSMVDWETPNLEEWPLSRGVHGRVCLLKPGDILFVPSSWWLIQQLSEAENISLEITLGLSQRVKPLPAVALRVSRNVELIIGDIDGPGKILYWLKILCEETERDVIDVWTVKGYDEIVAVWDAREDVDSVMGRGAWKSLFAKISEGRLRPTPWLNKDFVEPLYLKDKPRQVVDTRTEEQQKYPELFRHVKF